MSGGGEMDDIRARLGRLEEDYKGLARFQAWIMGIAAGAGAILGIFLDSIKKKLGV